MKIILAILSLTVITSCYNGEMAKENAKTNKSRSAQDRINASQSGANSITKELD